MRTVNTSGPVHLFDGRLSNRVHPQLGAYCGETGNIRAMTWHELKRGRITCAECLQEYARREAKESAR